MSDSDSELLTPNIMFPFQNESTTISAKGPSINISNLTGISFRNNVLTSTMNMPRNHEWKSRAASHCDQRSLGYRRETSPMSVASACDARQRNYNNLYYPRGMSSQRSVYNRRGGSPMSMRSIDSNATISASDIAMAFKTSQFNKYDMRIITEAYNKCVKKKVRKKIEKRRNLKLFHRGYRRKSGNDSGELGSNSSMSSDDNRSTRTSNYKSNMSSCGPTKTNSKDLRRTIEETNMFKDCTDNFRQNRMLSIIGRPENLNTSRSSVNSFRSMIEKPPLTKQIPLNFNKTQSQSSMTQQDRFKNGFLLPSQRFNRSVAAASIPEAAEKPHESQINHYQNVKNNNREQTENNKRVQELTSDYEEICSEITTIERPIHQRKRSFDSDDDICLPFQKKRKVASSKLFEASTVIENAKNDFQFAKPAFPVRKSANMKTKEKISINSVVMNTTEKLISRAPILNTEIQPCLQKSMNCILQQKDDEKELLVKEDDLEHSTISQNTTDLSMRPSFIKRKLFTQKIDVIENTNDAVANSPQNSIYGAIQKERNKTRKLITSQNCLSRDIDADESNLLDLIHKIVPSEKMNAINQTNKTAAHNNKSEDNDDRWDVTSIITSRNNDEDISDTFTDEDNMHTGTEKLQPSPKATVNLKKKSPPKILEKSKSKITQITQQVLVEKNTTPKKMVQKYVKSFWDTDFESDEDATSAARKEESKENKRSENVDQNVMLKDKFQGFSSMFPVNKTTIANNASIMNSTVDGGQRFNNTNRSFRLCSHRNTKPIAKKTVQEKSLFEPQNKKLKTTKANRCHDQTIQQDNELNQNKHENPKQETPLIEIKKSSQKKIIKTNKETTKETKAKEPLKKQNSIQDEVKPQKMKPAQKTTQIKQTSEKVKELDTVQNKKNTNKKQIKNDTTQQDNELNQNKHENPKQETPLIEIKKSPQKKKIKTNKETTKETKAKEPLKKQNSIQDEVKPQKMKPAQKTTQIKQTSEKAKELDTVQNKKNTNKNQIKNDAQASDNKKLNVLKSDTNNNPPSGSKTENTKQNSKNIKEQKAISTQLQTTVDNKNNKNSKITKNTNVSKLSDSLIYEDSFTETNNNKSIRPFRSCRNSKQKDSHNTSNATNTLSMSLRSRDRNSNNNTIESNPTIYSKKTISTKNEQSSISDQSFSLARDKLKKPLSSICNSRHLKTKDTSDVSFTITYDKDSPLPKPHQGNSTKSRINTKLMNRAVVSIQPIPLHKIDNYVLGKAKYAKTTKA